MRRILLLIFILISVRNFAQTTYPAGLPSPKADSGYAQYGYVRPLTLGHIVVGDTAIRAKYNGAARIWFHSGVDTALWIWKDTRWIKIGSGGSGGGGGGDGIISLGQGYGVIIVNDSTYDVDTSIIVNKEYFYNTIDSLITVFDGQYLDTAYYSSGPTVDTFIVEKNGVPYEWYVLDKTENGLISGGTIYWIDSLEYGITPAVYRINGVRYTSIAQTVTLDAADPDFDRLDAFYLDTDGLFGAITGDPSADPLLPTVDPATQLYLSFAQVNAANDTLPEGVTRTIIYDENLSTPDEWATGASGSWTVDFNSTLNPYHLTKNITTGSQATGKILTFTNTETISRASQTNLLFFVDLIGDMPSTSNIQVRFFNGTTAVTSAFTVTSAYGFSKTDVGYQAINIPLSAIAFTGPLFDRLQIIFTAANGGVYVDYVQLQGGINTGGGGIGTLTNLTVNGLNPLFTTTVTNPTSTPVVSFSAIPVSPYKLYGTSALTAVPSFIGPIDSNWVSGLHTEDYYNTIYTRIGDSMYFVYTAPISAEYLNDSTVRVYLDSGTVTGQLMWWDGSAWTTQYAIANGVAGTDSVLVESNGIVKKISPTYYGVGGGSGTVTSVDGSGGTTGLTLTGGPITTSGTLTLGGVLGIDHETAAVLFAPIVFQPIPMF